MNHILDGDAEVLEGTGQLSDTSRPVAHGHGELDQTSIGGMASLQAPAKHSRVDVAAAQKNDNAGKGHNGQSRVRITELKQLLDAKVQFLCGFNLLYTCPHCGLLKL